MTKHWVPPTACTSVNCLPLCVLPWSTAFFCVCFLGRCRYAWALVHSPRKADLAAGLKLAATLEREGEGEQRDVLYLQAVALYRQGKYLEARRTLDRLLEVRAVHGPRGGFVAHKEHVAVCWRARTMCSILAYPLPEYYSRHRQYFGTTLVPALLSARVVPCVTVVAGRHVAMLAWLYSIQFELLLLLPLDALFRACTLHSSTSCSCRRRTQLFVCLCKLFVCLCNAACRHTRRAARPGR